MNVLMHARRSSLLRRRVLMPALHCFRVAGAALQQSKACPTLAGAQPKGLPRFTGCNCVTVELGN